MQIINATKGVKKRMFNILLDGGVSMSIMPGQVSGVLVPSVNTIKAAINSGDPDEVGIVFGGSWEESVGRQITGGHPYYYTNLEEAKAKLLKDEDQSEESTKITDVVTDNSEVIANLQAEIKDLKEKLANSQANDTQNKFDTMKLEQAEDKVKNLEVKVKQLESENEGLKSDLNTNLAKVQELEAFKTKSLEDTKLLNTQLEESQNKIDQMRSTFNSVCDQFNIDFDSEKGWFIKD